MFQTVIKLCERSEIPVARETRIRLFPHSSWQTEQSCSKLFKLFFIPNILPFKCVAEITKTKKLKPLTEAAFTCSAVTLCDI